MTDLSDLELKEAPTLKLLWEALEGLGFEEQRMSQGGFRYIERRLNAVLEALEGEVFVVLENQGAVTENVSVFPTRAQAIGAVEAVAEKHGLLREGDFWTDDADRDVFVKPARWF